MKSFAIACLAAVSTNAVALESDYSHPWLEVEDDEVLVPDLDLADIEKDLNDGKLVPVAAIDKEILVVEAPKESDDEESEDEEEESEEAEEDSAEDYDVEELEVLDVDSVLEQVALGFDNIHLTNAGIEDADIKKT